MLTVTLQADCVTDYKTSTHSSNKDKEETFVQPGVILNVTPVVQVKLVSIITAIRGSYTLQGRKSICKGSK